LFEIHEVKLLRGSTHCFAKICLRVIDIPARISGLSASLLLLAGCVGVFNNISQISGYVYPSADILSDDNVYVRIALLDVSKMDVAAMVLSESETIVKPSWPLRYSLNYDPLQLDTRMTYGISVRISDKDDRLLAINDTAHRFSSDSDSGNFDVLVKPVKSRVSTLAELKIACAEKQYRIYIYKGFLLRYNRETGSRQIFTQERSTSGRRYTRDLESLFLKGSNPPLYLVGDNKIRCELVDAG
jgi:uncharacterized lipoprotein YbaY